MTFGDLNYFVEKRAERCREEIGAGFRSRIDVLPLTDVNISVAGFAKSSSAVSELNNGGRFEVDLRWCSRKTELLLQRPVRTIPKQ